MMRAPVHMRWEGDAMKPASHAAQRFADQAFVIGETYMLVEEKPRSRKSHDHYFACVQDAWETLPDRAALVFPSSEHLRKHALVRCGYADKMTVVCESEKAARRFAIECRGKDLFAVVDLEGCMVTMWTAHSQSMKAMGKQSFTESKNAVLDWLGKTFGYAPEQLGEAA